MSAGDEAAPATRAAEGALDPLLEHAPAGFLSFADDGTVVRVNATLLALLGLERADVVGRHVEALLTVGGRIFYQTHLFPLLSMQGRVEEIFLLLRHRDGEPVGALLNAVRREGDGAPVTDCVLVRVQERRKYEEALLRARREAEAALAALAARTRELEAANEQLESQAVELELQQQQLQEQTTALELAGEELRTTNDTLTEQAEELERQRVAADEANRAKSTFLTIMSHELRTPLNAIGGYAQLLELEIPGPITEEQRQIIERLLRSQRHLLRLINDVLNLSRIEAGRVEYTLETIPAGELVDGVLPMIEPQLAERGIACIVAVSTGLRVRADREKAEQILLNLLSNAMKFTPAGGRVVVDTAQHAQSPGKVFVRVSDTGIGIPRDRLEEVFEPFVQMDATHTRRAEGTGLGLAISRDLARGMGGDLRARSHEGKGSTFTLTLPAA